MQNYDFSSEEELILFRFFPFCVIYNLINYLIQRFVLYPERGKSIGQGDYHSNMMSVRGSLSSQVKLSKLMSSSIFSQ